MTSSIRGLDNFWLPFTANRMFKKSPRLITGAKGMFYYTSQGQEVLDATSGLWCVNAGHGRLEIRDAVASQMESLDYAPSFLQLSHPLAFELAHQISELSPKGLSKIFFTNSGSDAVDTALKIALAYHQKNGEPQRSRFVGRSRSYHGVNFGGMSVGGIQNNQEAFSSSLLHGVCHMRHTHNLKKQQFSRGQPEWGAEIADDLKNLIGMYGAKTIAAVIIEPIAGSTGLLVPPLGYLERLLNIARENGILVIFDEVITGFGRLGVAFAAQYFNLSPDMIVMGKGITNASIPMGAVAVKDEIYETVVSESPIYSPEFFHGYTYSAHPSACAAALAALKIYSDENLFFRSSEMSKYFEDGIHSLKKAPIVVDIRNLGMLGAIELREVNDYIGCIALEVHYRCFSKGLLVRHTGNSITISPPLIASYQDIDQIIDTLDLVLHSF